jgi:hypothetical protein
MGTAITAARAADSTRLEKLFFSVLIENYLLKMIMIVEQKIVPPLISVIEVKPPSSIFPQNRKEISAIIYPSY